jgi:hypothetical protein
MVIAGAFIFAVPSGINVLITLIFLSIGGWVIVIINEIIFRARKEQLKIDRDETIKHPALSLVLAICPRCKSRVPSTSKYCGTDLVSPV